jgi:hypothetical protein
VIRFAAVLLALTYLASPISAAEKAKSDFDALTSPQLGDYTLKLDTDKPENPGPSAPPDLRIPSRTGPVPFVGFSLSRPLPDNFFGR